MGQRPRQAIARLTRLSVLLNQQRQKAQKAIDRAPLSQRAEPQQLPLVLVAKSIEHFPAKMRPIVEIVPVHPQHHRLINVGIALEGERRLSHNHKRLACSHKAQKGFLRTDVGQTGHRAVLACADLGRAHQPHRAPLNQVQKTWTGRNSLILTERSTAIVLLGPVKDALPSQEGARFLYRRVYRMHKISRKLYQMFNVRR